MIQALNKWIVVKEDEYQESTKGGIVLLEAFKETYSTGTVLSVGEGWMHRSGRRIPLGWEVGDKVLFRNNASTDYVVDGEKVHLLQDCDIYCKVLPCDQRSFWQRFPSPPSSHRRVRSKVRQ